MHVLANSASLDYWMATADGAPPALDLYPDFLRGREHVAATESVVFEVDSAAATALRAFAGSDPTRTRSALLAVWATLLYRYSGQTDVLVGFTESPSDRTFALARFRAGSDVRGEELLTQAADAVGQVSAASPGSSVSPVSMPEMLRAMGAEPAITSHPIFQAAIVFCDRASDLARSMSWSDDFAPCDVALNATAPTDGTAPGFTIHYRSELFAAERIRRMGEHFGGLLAAMLSGPSQGCGSYPIVQAEEKAQINAWNATEFSGAVPTALATFEACVASSPTATALEFNGDALTYVELDQRASELARTLRSHGIGPNRLVAISVERSFAMIVSLVAVMKTGGAYVPIDPGYPAERRTYMLEDSGAAVVLSGPTATGDVAVEVRGSAAPADAAAEDATAEFAPIGYVIYTSGSTGRPKGVELPWRALDNLIHWQLGRPGFERGRRTLQFTSLSFDVSFQEIVSTLCSGGTLVLISDAERRDPMPFLDKVIEHRIARLFLPFVALRGLAHASESTARNPDTLREVYTAGEQLHIDDCVRAFFAALPECLLENQYGPSESHVVTAFRLSGPAAGWPVLPAIGLPIQNSKIMILNDRHQLQPVGVVGDLHIGGLCLAHGYRNRGDLTGEKFQQLTICGQGPATWYKAGDLARYTSDGSIEFLGRSDSQVKFRGYRIELGEVSATISNHPSVEQCVATVRDVAGFGPKLIAFLKAPADVAVDRVPLHEVRRYAEDRLPDYMVPSHFAVVPAFTLTPSGKVDTESLPTPDFNRAVLDTTYTEPTTFPEIWMQRIWRTLLGIENIGVNDDFFVLGGNSLMAVEMFSMIRTEFNTDLPLGALAADPTIAGLVSRLGSGTQRWDVVVPMTTVGAKTPVFCVHGGYGNVASFPLLARGLPSDQPFYGLQWDGLNGSKGTRGVKNMAKLYVQEIQKIQPRGPYILSGQCVGAIIAREMARVLQAKGERVEQMILFDAPRLEGPTFEPRKLSVVAKQKLADPKALLRDARTLVFAARAEVESRFSEVRPENRPLHTSYVMIRALNRFKLRDVQVQTLYVSSRAKDPAKLGFSGRWTDEALGWSTFESPSFTIFPVTWTHTEIMYEPQTIAAVTKVLNETHDRIKRS